MSTDDIEEIGPIDNVVIEWPGKQPSGEAAPLLVDLVDRGVIRVLDLVFVNKDEDGGVAAIEFAEVAAAVPVHLLRAPTGLHTMISTLAELTRLDGELS